MKCARSSGSRIAPRCFDLPGTYSSCRKMVASSMSSRLGHLDVSRGNDSFMISSDPGRNPVIDGERSGTGQEEGRQARQIEQIGLVPWWPEFGSICRDGEQ